MKLRLSKSDGLRSVWDPSNKYSAQFCRSIEKISFKFNLFLLSKFYVGRIWRLRLRLKGVEPCLKESFSTFRADADMDFQFAAILHTRCEKLINRFMRAMKTTKLCILCEWMNVWGSCNQRKWKREKKKFHILPSGAWINIPWKTSFSFAARTTGEVTFLESSFHAYPPTQKASLTYFFSFAVVFVTCSVLVSTL